MIKISYQSEYRGAISQHDKGIYDKLRVILIFDGEKLKAFLLNSGTRQGFPLSPLLFDIILEVVATALKQGKSI